MQNKFYYKQFTIKFQKFGNAKIFENNQFIGDFDFDFFNKKYIFSSVSTLFDKVQPIFESSNMKINELSPKDLLLEQIKKGIDFYLKFQKKLIENTIYNYQFYASINKYNFDLTCESFPQQYDVYCNQQYIGYIRIRHGFASFENYPLGNIIYLQKPHDYNKTRKERIAFLTECISAYYNYKGEKNEF